MAEIKIKAGAQSQIEFTVNSEKLIYLVEFVIEYFKTVFNTK